MKLILRIVGAIIITFVLWRAWQWFFITDEIRVKRQISAMTRAVEKGDVLRLSNALAADYNDDWGMDRSTLIGAVHSFRAQYDAMFVHISDLSVTIDSDHQKGQAVFIAKVIAKAKGSLSDSEVRAERFRLYFRNTDSGWKLIRTESPELKFE